MKIFLASIVSIILSTQAFSKEEDAKHSPINISEFCIQSIRIADYHLTVYNRIHHGEYIDGYWQGQKDAFISIIDFIKE